MRDAEKAKQWEIGQAIALLDQGGAEPAVRKLERLLRSHPDDVDVLRALTRAMCEAKLHPQLDQILRGAMQRKGQTGELLALYGVLQQSVGKFDQAVETLKAAARLAPESGEVLAVLGDALQSVRRYAEAYSAFAQAERAGAAPERVHLGYAAALGSLGSLPEALANLRKAAERQPDSPAVLCLLGKNLRLLGRIDESRAAYERAIAIAPNRTNPVLGLAELFAFTGREGEAASLLRRVMDSGRLDAEVALIAARISKKLGSARETLLLLDRALARQEEQPASRYSLLFTRGALLEQMAEYNEAFASYRSANDMSAADLTFDIFRQRFDALESVFSAENLRAWRGCCAAAARPIFIVGMPRSGTSLVEQILSMHPAVTAAGELDYIPQITVQAANELGRPFPECVAAAQPEDWRRWSAADAARLDRMSEGRPHLTDKLPHNFMNLGLISVLHPTARVIHCLRDPLDNCLSVYATRLNFAHRYRSRLSWLGEYYQRYRRLMEHWKASLELPILDLSYEALVDDVEGETRRMLRFLELPWEPRCLRYYESDRITLTASMDQVRRPIYKSSVNRAERFGAHLDELRTALGPFSRPRATT